MKLTVVAINGQISLQDPNPTEGIFSISLNQGETGYYYPTPAQLERIKPALMDLESRVVDGAPLMSWAIDRTTTDDERAEVPTLLTLPKLTQMVAGGVNPAGVADLEFMGSNLLAAQTKAYKVIGDLDTLGQVRYTAVLPGAPGNLIRVRHVVAGLGTPLTIAVVSNDITVNVATDGAGLPTSTAADVRTAVNADAAAKLLVLASVETAGVVQAEAYNYLAGGLGEGCSLKIAGTTCTILSISNTSMHALVPALPGVATTDTVEIVLRTGGQVCVVTGPPYATALGPGGVSYPELNDAVYGDHEDQAGAGALDLTHRTAYCTSAAPGAVLTLADAVVQGHRKSIILTGLTTPGTDSIVVTPTHGGPWTLDTVNDSIEIEWDGTNWVLVNDNRNSIVAVDYRNLANRIYGDHEDQAGAGALDITHRSAFVTTAAAGEVMTLADGATGQRKSIMLTTVGVPGTDTAVITPAHGGPWTMDRAGDSIEIEFDGTNWVLINDNRAVSRVVLYRNLDASIHGAHQDIAGAGAIDVTHRTTFIGVVAAGEVFTLADGVAGQRKSLYLSSVGTPGTDTAVITPTHGGPWTMATAGDSMEIEFDGTNWVLINDNRRAILAIDYDVLNDAIYGAHQDLAGAGNIDITHRTTYVTSAAAGAVMNLADGAHTGQRKTIRCSGLTTSGTDTCVVTPAHGTARILAYVGDAIELEWDGANWITVVDGRIGTCAKIGSTVRIAAQAHFLNPPAADLVSIVADAPCADGACVLAAQPVYPCKLQIRITIAVNAITGGVLTITSVDQNGKALVEVISLVAAVSVTKTTTYAHGRITSLVVSGLVGGGGAGDNLSVGQSSALGLPGAQTATTYQEHKENRDGADEALGTLDATAGTVIPSHAPDGAHDYDIWYSYLMPLP